MTPSPPHMTAPTYDLHRSLTIIYKVLTAKLHIQNSKYQNMNFSCSTYCKNNMQHSKNPSSDICCFRCASCYSYMTKPPFYIYIHICGFLSFTPHFDSSWISDVRFGLSTPGLLQGDILAITIQTRLCPGSTNLCQGIYPQPKVIQDSNPDFQINPDSDPDVRCTVPKMVRIHYLVGVKKINCTST